MIVLDLGDGIELVDHHGHEPAPTPVQPAAPDYTDARQAVIDQMQHLLTVVDVGDDSILVHVEPDVDAERPQHLSTEFSGHSNSILREGDLGRAVTSLLQASRTLDSDSIWAAMGSDPNVIVREVWSTSGDHYFASVTLTKAAGSVPTGNDIDAIDAWLAADPVKRAEDYIEAEWAEMNAWISGEHYIVFARDLANDNTELIGGVVDYDGCDGVHVTAYAHELRDGLLAQRTAQPSETAA